MLTSVPVVVAGLVLAAAGEDFEAEVAASFGPFVRLLGQHRADQVHDRVPVREDAHRVSAAADLAVEALGRVVGPAALPDRAGQVGRDGLHEVGVRVGDDQADPGQATGDQIGEELVPGRPGLAGGDPPILAEFSAVATASWNSRRRAHQH